MADVVIVGGGVVGCATALELARAGHRPVLLEGGSIAAGVSGASLAAIARHLVGPVDELPFVLESTARWFALDQELREKTAIDIELERCGQLRLIEERDDGQAKDELARATAIVEAEQAAGLEVEMLTPEGARRIVPLLDRGAIAGASWCPGDAKLNALLACRGLAAAARRRGAEIRTGWVVQRLVPDKRWRVETSRGTVEAETVVLATGPWTPFLLHPLEPVLAAAIVPKRAQCCATESVPPLIRPIVASVSVGVSLGYTQLHQTRHGEILFNTVVESNDPRTDGELDIGVDQHFLVESARTFARLFPSLARVRLLRSWAACEAWTADQRFLLGPIEGHPGLIVAAGDSGTGFLRAPLLGHIVAQLVAGESPDFDLDPYRPDRRAREPVES